MNRYIKNTCFLAMLFAGYCQAEAIPAYPGIQRFVQPDGYVLNVQAVGDEAFSYVETVDGYLLVQENGAFYYACTNADGILASTGILAKNAEDRTAEETEMLEGLDYGQALQTMMRTSAIREKQAYSGTTTYPCFGEQKGLVVLVDFPDKKFSLENPEQEFDEMLNKIGYDKYNATGSAYDYFFDSSYGQFQPTFDIYGPLTMSKDAREYGKNGTNGAIDLGALDMVKEACQQLYDSGVNLKDYDRDGDGVVDNVYIFYAGRGEADNVGQPDLIWPHSSSFDNWFEEPLQLGEVSIQKYACSNELNNNDVMCGIGTFCHEFSHVLGLPDLYMTVKSSQVAFTPGTWSALDTGPYNNDGRTPPSFSIYERYALGWIEPVELNKPLSVELDVISAKQGYIIKTEQEDEYFLVENRQQSGWDTFIPGHGMLVWHIDYKKSLWDANIVNNNAGHQYVDLEEADNDLSDYSRDGDSFPGAYGITSFTDNTMPSMRDWKNNKLEKPITDIREEEGKIYFDFMGGGLGIDSASEEGEFNVYAQDNMVVVENFTSNAADVKVYNVQGMEIFSGVCEGKAAVSVAPGMYIVSVAGNYSKVLVK